VQVGCSPPTSLDGRDWPAGFWWLIQRRQGLHEEAEDATTARAIATALPGGNAPTTSSGGAAALTNCRPWRKHADAPRLQTVRHGVRGGSGSRGYDRGIGGMMLPFVWRYLRDGLDDPQTAAALRTSRNCT
jgi:hypothetical protein